MCTLLVALLTTITTLGTTADADLLKRELPDGGTLVVRNDAETDSLQAIVRVDGQDRVIWSAPKRIQPIMPGDTELKWEVLDAVVTDDEFVIVVRNGIRIWAVRRVLSPFMTEIGESGVVEEVTGLRPRWNLIAVADHAARSRVEGVLQQNDARLWTIEFRQLLHSNEEQSHNTTFTQTDGKWEFTRVEE